MENIQNKCIICEQLFCFQSTDHIKLTYQQFDQKLRNKAGFEPNIAKLKNKIGKCYEKIQQNSHCQENLEPYVIDLFLMIDKLHFWHFLRFTDSLCDIEAAIFGIPLPKNKIIKLINILEQEPDYKCSFPKFDKLLSEIHKFKKNTKKIIQNRLYDELVFKLADIIKQCEQQFVKNRDSIILNQEMGNMKINRNENPGMPSKKIQEAAASEIVMIQEVPFSTQRKSIDLSVLEFTDHTFFRCYNSLQKMQQVQQLQLRNNRLSERSYRMLLKSFPNLQTLDISSSNCQSFFKSLQSSSGAILPNLKTLYLNQSNLTNENLKKIPEYFPKLRVLYADYNLLSNQGIQELYNKKKQLIYVSVKGNFVDQIFANRMQVNLVIHGGYLEY